MHPDVGSIVWEDGTNPVLVVGHGTDEQNVADERLFVVDLGEARILEPDEHGAYAFGAAPYVAGSNNRDVNDPQPVGGFGPDTPIGGTSENATTSSSDGAPLVPGAPGQFVGDAPARNTAFGNGGDNGTRTDTGPGDGSGDATYTSNGDGTYTRDSDGQRGTFGPSGFTANA